MYIVTLLTNPETPALDRVTVESLRNAWGGGDVRWLKPAVAAEFAVGMVPANRWDVWGGLQAMGVDMVVQPAEGRKKRLLIADMDSTMIKQECIDELAVEAGIGPHVSAITARAMNGELNFEDALRERVALLRGLPEAVIEQVFVNRITFTPGGAVLIATMKAAGAYSALVSGGFTAFTERVGTQLGFEEHRANVLNVENGALAGTVTEPILGSDAKVQALREIAERLGLTLQDAMAVGDGANDLAMLGVAGTGVALHAKPIVAAQCDIRIHHGDLTALLYIQGYAFEEFC
jgi:phosphoserine phosphatase